MEITRAFLPGKNDKEKESYLHPDTQAELRNSYHKLFDLANNRLNTRHAVNHKSDTIELHTKLNGEELDDFYHDFDLISRSVVCDYFQEEVVILKKKEDREFVT
ncbi:MAG TPA: hypothetical protein ENJ28_03990 [Gammaproteobacteria bacterium]|nr:hypothetical protein [Gammaproteobacteria bacterium]